MIRHVNIQGKPRFGWKVIIMLTFDDVALIVEEGKSLKKTLALAYNKARVITSNRKQEKELG